MDFAFFESLSVDDAEGLLSGFLASEAEAIEGMRPEAAASGVQLDFSSDHLSDVAKWFASRLTMIQRPASHEVPEWIRKTYRDNMICEFDEDSKNLVLRAAYYMGETFVRTYPQLRWTIGNRETIAKNMPVVTGFDFQMELAVILVIENVFQRIAGHGAPLSHIDKAIDGWRRRVPANP